MQAVSHTVQRVFFALCEGFCYQPRWVFIATWHNVSRYTSSTARDTVGIICQLQSIQVALDKPMSVAPIFQSDTMFVNHHYNTT